MKHEVGVAYILWALSFLGIAGLNRLYTGRYISGIIWVLTWGLFGIGIFWDMFRIPNHVRDAELRDKYYKR